MSRRASVGSSQAALWLLVLGCASCAGDDHTPPETAGRAAALSASADVAVLGDTYLKSGSPNQNQGGELSLRLQSSGQNRALLFFDPAAIASAVGSGSLTHADLETSGYTVSLPSRGFQGTLVYWELPCLRQGGQSDES